MYNELSSFFFVSLHKWHFVIIFVVLPYQKLEKLITGQGQTSRDRFPVMTRPQLDKIVKDADLDLDADELQHAVRFLHESGVLLHYDDASLRLRNLYFIDPEWLCRMFAQIVTVREINPFISEAGVGFQQNASAIGLLSNRA